MQTNYTFVQKDKQEIIINVAFPKAINYDLQIFTIHKYTDKWTKLAHQENDIF